MNFRLYDLEPVLLNLDGVLDGVILRRSLPRVQSTASLTVVYVVPSPGTDLRVLRRKIDRALAHRVTDLVVTMPVTRVPRTGEGTPDVAALVRLPVLTGDSLRAFTAEWGAYVELAPADEQIPQSAVLDADAPPAVARPTPRRAPDHIPWPATSSRQSLVVGPPLSRLSADPHTLSEAITAAAERFPDRGVRAVSWDTDTFITYPELLARARKVLGGMRAQGMRPGSYTILLVPRLTDYFPAVWACLLGGITCVTVTAPPSFDARNPVLDKLMHAWRALGRPPVITDDATVDAVAGLRDLYGEPALTWLSVAELEICPDDGDVHPADPADVAILALSSGSTGQPKIIQVTHRAVVENALSARQVDLIRPGETSFNWLPFDHVAPLVMYLLRDVVLGCDSIHAPTGYIAEQPLRWLDVLSKYRVHHTWSANFAYRLIADALRDGRQDAGWELSGVRTMLNAGEQCIPSVMRDFLARVRPYGISERTIVHMWGMAETATGATCKFFVHEGSVRRILKSSLDGTLRAAEPDDESPCLEFMSMGPAAPGAAVRVADGSGRVLPEGVIGRFQVRSSRVTPGYLDNADADADAFTGDGWFDTGDLAFVMDGEAVISGRAKELIVINGDKHYCHEIEDVVSELDGVSPGLVAACGVPDPATGSEALAIFFVPAAPTADPPVDTIERVHRAVAERLRLAAAHVLPIAEADFPRTTSGKIQRAALVRRVESGEFATLIRSLAAARGTATTAPDCLFRPAWHPLEPRPTANVATTGTTLVFADDLGLAGHLTAPDTILITPGDRFTAGPGHYTVNPATLADWTALRQAVPSPATLLYLWSYLPTPDPAGPRDHVDQALRRCAADLVRACQTFHPDRLITVSRQLRPITGEDDLCYPAAAAAAITATLARERPGTTTCHIDLPGDSPADDARTLLRALTDHSVRHGEVAWRDGRPHVKELLPVTEPADGRDPLRRGGHYLVTGGAGGVGAALLPILAERYDTAFLVVGRRSPEDSPELQDLWRTLGSRRILYQQVDVLDPVALEAAVTAAEAAWEHPIDGVLHLAGAYHLRPLASEDPDAWYPDPKVDGLLNLVALLRDRPGAGLITFSSLLGHLGTAGCAAYGAAAATADALTERLNARTAIPAHSLAWGLWQNLGVNRDNPHEAAAVQRGVLSLPAAQGGLYTRILLRRPPGVYYAGLNPRAAEIRETVHDAGLLERLILRPGEEGAPAQPMLCHDPFGVPVEVALPAPPPWPEGGGGAADGIVHTIQDTLEGLLGQPVQPTDRLYELGVSSIQLLQIRARLEAALGLEVPNSALFEQPTLLDLARSLTPA